MVNFSVSHLIPVLQTAIGPVVLISGVGLLILSMTNRLGRVIDRGRSLIRELPRLHADFEISRVRAQLEILSFRAKLLQQAIILASISVLFAALLVIVLFLSALFEFESAWLIGGIFIIGLGSLILSLIQFIRDLNQSLRAFSIDIGEQP
ncbi:MAG: DUF2721 domain-containing protein [Anaerolineales bacterium]|nr:DUF2721 domain-containing protein [Anaerolineales bacterium]